MHKPFAVAAMLAAACGAQAATDDDLAAIRSQIDDMKKIYEQRIAALEKKLADAESRAKAEPQSPTAAKAPASAPATTAASAGPAPAMAGPPSRRGSRRWRGARDVRGGGGGRGCTCRVSDGQHMAERRTRRYIARHPTRRGMVPP